MKSRPEGLDHSNPGSVHGPDWRAAMKSRPEGLDHQRIHLCHRHRGSRRNEVEARRPRSRAVNFGGDGLVDAAMKSRPEGLDHLELLGVSALAPVAAMKSRPEGLDHRPAGPGSSRRADSRNEVEARRPRSPGTYHAIPGLKQAAMKSRPEGLDHDTRKSGRSSSTTAAMKSRPEGLDHSTPAACTFTTASPQ